MSPTGSYGIADLIAARFTTTKQMGMDTVAAVLRADLAAHNERVNMQIRELCEVGSDAYRIAGSSANSTMTEVDEYGAAPSQKDPGGEQIGFPLRRFQFNTGWTEAWLENAKVSDIAQRQLSAEIAHLAQINTQIRNAIFRAANYNFTDLNVDNVVLGVRRFLNADSLAAIPNGPDGTVFDNTTHTHFTAAAALAVADLTAAINTVIEHGHGGAVKLCINSAQEAAVRVLAGFVAYPDPRITTILTALQSGNTLDQSRLNDRAIGVLSGAEVWVKSWVPSNYYFVYDSADTRKPLYFRVASGSSFNTLRTVSNFTTHPLGGEYMEALFGIGVWTRTNGAAHFDNGAAWADAV